MECSRQFRPGIPDWFPNELTCCCFSGTSTTARKLSRSRARPHSDLCSELIAQGALSGILYILEEEVHVIQFVEEPVVILKVE